MILLRTTRVDPATVAFARQLEQASGERIAMLVDERQGVVDTHGRDKVSLTHQACAAIGLYAPSDFAWRCGDYGFYVARARFPDERHYWMIEYDVRLTGDAGRFFAAWQSRPAVDLVAAHIGPAGGDWWWRATVTSSDAEPRRCFFPVVRLSARAVDALATKRRQHSRRPLRRALWPNDESFVATAAQAAGLTAADLNDAGFRVYDDETYSYTNVLDGAALADDAPDAAPRLYHPVLEGDDLARKLARTQKDHGKPTPLAERAYRKLVARVNGATKW